MRCQRSSNHICFLYESEAYQYALLTSFFQIGLRNNEKIVYIVSDENSKKVFNVLQNKLPFINCFLAKGQIQSISLEDFYKKKQLFSIERMLITLEEKTERALEEKYSGLRIAGEASWIIEVASDYYLLEYESRMNHFFDNNQCVGLCMYNRSNFSHQVLLQVLHTHPFIADRTDVYKNDYYIPTAEYLKRKFFDVKHQRFNCVDTYKTTVDRIYGGLYIEQLKDELKELYNRGYTMKDDKLVEASQYLDQYIYKHQLFFK